MTEESAGRFSADIVLQTKWNQFGFDRHKDIVGSTTVAAGVLLKFEKDTSPIHKQCLSQTLDIAVWDVLCNNYYQELSAKNSD